MNGTEQQLTNVITDLLHMDSDIVSSDMCIREDLQADSLDVVEFIIATAEFFDIKIRDAEVQSLKTIGEIAAYIDSKMISNHAMVNGIEI